MKNTCRSARQRAQLLVAFARSGLSAAAFARQHRINYTTFCGWRQRHAPSQHPPAFVEVELVARLLQALNPPRPC